MSVAAPSNKSSIERKCGRLEAAGTWSAYYKEHAWQALHNKEYVLRSGNSLTICSSQEKMDFVSVPTVGDQVMEGNIASVL